MDCLHRRVAAAARSNLALRHRAHCPQQPGPAPARDIGRLTEEPAPIAPLDCAPAQRGASPRAPARNQHAQRARRAQAAQATAIAGLTERRLGRCPRLQPDDPGFRRFHEPTMVRTRCNCNNAALASRVRAMNSAAPSSDDFLALLASHRTGGFFRAMGASGHQRRPFALVPGPFVQPPGHGDGWRGGSAGP